MTNKFLNITDGIKAEVSKWHRTLLDMDEVLITQKLNRQNRSIKQILGHMIDSASNNHQRMVRLQYDGNLAFPDYRQDNDLWIKIENYQNANWVMLLNLWKAYNLFLCHIIENTDESKLNNYWYDFEGTKVTLRKMIEGYLDHLRLHLGEIAVIAERGGNLK